MTIFTERCVVGITANPDQCLRHLDGSTAVATALTPIFGGERSSEIAKQVLASGLTIREVLRGAPDLTDEVIARAGDLLALTRPSRARLGRP